MVIKSNLIYLLRQSLASEIGYLDGYFDFVFLKLVLIIHFRFYSITYYYFDEDIES